jgi:hypothetical protein
LVCTFYWKIEILRAISFPHHSSLLVLVINHIDSAKYIPYISYLKYLYFTSWYQERRNEKVMHFFDKLDLHRCRKKWWTITIYLMHVFTCLRQSDHFEHNDLFVIFYHVHLTCYFIWSHIVFQMYCSAFSLLPISHSCLTTAIQMFKIFRFILLFYCPMFSF